MKRLLTLVTLMALLSCSGTSLAPHEPTNRSCRIPAAVPPPQLHADADGDLVCLTVDDAVSLIKWIHAQKELEWALAGCPYIDRS